MRRIIRSGFLPAAILTIAGLILYVVYVPPNANDVRNECLIVTAGVLLWLFMYARRLARPSEEAAHLGKEKHMYPAPPEQMLFKQPTGFTFGKYGRKYVCRPIEAPGNILILGGTGTGKSSALIIPYLLEQKKAGGCHNLIVDIKGELRDLTQMPGDGSIVVDPTDRRSYGIDPFWGLTPDSSPQDIFEVCQLVAVSLIPAKDGKDAFWTTSAQQMLLGFLLYLYKYQDMRNLTDMLTYILSHPVEELAEEVLTTALPGSDEYMATIDFGANAAKDTVSGIFSNLKQTIFPLVSDKNVAYCLGNNPDKFRPDMILTGDVYLCIPQNKLEQYGRLVFLAINLFCLWALSLPQKIQDPDRPYLGVIIDETTALLSGLGTGIPLVVQMLRICRSLGIMMLIATQSLEGLRCVYTKEQTDDLVSNCLYRVVLNATTPDSQKMISDWAGVYRRQNTTWNQQNGGRTTSVSYSEEKIVQPADLNTLGGTDDLILISAVGGYNRLKKVPYYREPYYREIYEDIKSKKERRDDG